MLLPRVYSNQDREAIKKKRLITGGSPAFEVEISNLSAEAQKLYGFESEAEIRKFLPLNFLRIINDAETDLKVYVNQGSNGERVKKNTIYNYYGDFYSFIIENLSADTEATGADIVVTVQRKPAGG